MPEQTSRIELAVESGGHVGTVSIAGEVDPHTAPELESELDALLGDSEVSTLVLELRALTFIDSSGLRVLVQALKRLDDRSGRLVLRNPNAATRRLLDVTGLTEHVELEESS